MTSTAVRTVCELQGTPVVFDRSSRAAERAGFEPAEEREPLAGLANRCLGPLDYLSKLEFYRRGLRRSIADSCCRALAQRAVGTDHVFREAKP